MITNRMGSFGLIAGGLIAGLSLTATQGCDEVGNLAEQCGLTCDSEAFINGKFNVSGIAEIDAFFSATLDVSGAINATAADIQAELAGLYALVGVEAGGDFKAALDAKLSAWIDVDAGLQIKAEPARCEASLDVTAKAAAECDVMAKPGSVEVSCSGACEVDVSAQADCRAAGGLTCKGKAPNFECSGSCTGECRIEAGAMCDGTCRGECNGNTNFEGRCDTECKGTCELSAGGTCNGQCTGTCEYDPGSADCEAGAEVRCSATAEANVECKGGCEGKATPPQVSAECEATVEAKAEASVQCYPPSLDVSYKLTVDAGSQGELDLKVFISSFKLRYSALLAAIARAEGLIDVSAKLGDAGVAAVNSAAGTLKASGDLKASIGAACAIGLLPDAAKLITDAAGKLGTQLEAAGSVTASIASN
ncbi:hypothetical protein [Nannocystis pusilla]|uniref:hypothetical protein n=1 Tax=Nannocystis pusilla TaxID=889268 RepID=UPI003BF127DB